ncbi:hypothetical protein Tco_1185504 [Tanacetum coccineum]
MADDQEIENIQDEEGKNVEDQQVSEVDDDTNIDDFGCSLPHHTGADFDSRRVGANKDSNPNGVFNDVGGVRYSKADGTWVPARRFEDGINIEWFSSVKSTKLKNNSSLLLYFLKELAHAIVEDLLMKLFEVGFEEPEHDMCIGCRILLPGLTYAIYRLSMGNSDLIGGDGWASSLAEVPIIMSNNGNIGSAP